MNFTDDQQKLANELATNGWKPTIVGREWLSGSGLYRVRFIGDGTTVLEIPVWGEYGEVCPPDDLSRGMRAVGVLKHA